MKILKIDSGKLEIRTDRGSYVRTICSKDVIDAYFNEDESLVVITYNNGKVELRKENASYVRTIVSRGAISARWQGKHQ